MSDRKITPASSRYSAGLVRVVAIFLLALGGVSLLLLILNLSPLQIGAVMIEGTTTSWLKISNILSIWVPLLLCSCGLLFTFRAGLWNIGIEGQVIVGAIGATLTLRQSLAIPPDFQIFFAFAFAFLCGGLWGGAGGWLKNRGGVNEIFGGLGLNFVAQGLILWLILSPWKREGIASMSGTDLFAKKLWMLLPPGWRVSPSALLLATSIYALTAILLNYTQFGLKIKATGANPRAAKLFAINPDRYGFVTMMLGGGCAGLAGAFQASCVYHRLLPSISSGYGYLALLVVMLAGFRSLPVPLICLFFGFLAGGSIQLPIVLHLDSSLSGVIQGAFVLAALIVHGIYQKKRMN